MKERFLDEEEIVEHVVHNESRKVCWTMHRPRNGWYIRIRSPSFPPGAFIPLIPPLPNTPHPSGALLFSSRTNIPTVSDAPSRASTSTVHSYPPTPPPAVVVHPPPPRPCRRSSSRPRASSGASRPDAGHRVRPGTVHGRGDQAGADDVLPACVLRDQEPNRGSLVLVHPCARAPPVCSLAAVLCLAHRHHPYAFTGRVHSAAGGTSGAATSPDVPRPHTNNDSQYHHWSYRS
ncbi:hypothetical protein B0H13DRAFT_129134 [Mycena leptocephala]|nr:hypothetical protein B0H13DRAFT_129134 [Mycena leptocephala]